MENPFWWLLQLSKNVKIKPPKSLSFSAERCTRRKEKTAFLKWQRKKEREKRKKRKEKNGEKGTSGSLLRHRGSYAWYPFYATIPEDNTKVEYLTLRSPTEKQMVVVQLSPNEVIPNGKCVIKVSFRIRTTSLLIAINITPVIRKKMLKYV